MESHSLDNRSVRLRVCLPGFGGHGSSCETALGTIGPWNSSGGEDDRFQGPKSPNTGCVLGWISGNYGDSPC